MKRLIQASLGTAALLGGALALSACAPSTFPEFEREQTAQDKVAIPDDTQTIDTESTRFVGEVEGFDLFLARASSPVSSVCVVVVDAATDEWQSIGCGAGDGVGIELESGTVIEVGAHHTPDQDGERTKLSESVTVVASGS